jgi:hypothetical protein
MSIQLQGLPYGSLSLAQRCRLSIIVPEDKAAAFANNTSPDFDTTSELRANVKSGVWAT